MINPNSKNTYSIQQVSELTGLSKQVIRKWEERYGIINPQRLENGYRVYTHQELNTLQRIQALITEGMTVKQAISAFNNERLTPDTQTIFSNEAEPPKYNYTEQVINTLLHEGAENKDVNMLHILQQAHHTLGVKSLIYDVIIPFLQKVGEKWYVGEWGEYKEAISTQVIRDFLANLRRHLHVQEDAPLVLGSCLPNERHEIPLQILMLQSLLLGYRSIMLGPAPAPKAIQAIVEQTHPKIVLLSALTTSGFEDNYKGIDELDAFAEKYPHIRFYLGGPGAFKALENHPLKNIELTNNPSDIFLEL